MISLPRYENYKDSGVEWLGKIPEHWELSSGRNCFVQQEVKNKGNLEKTVLSLSYGRIIIKPEEKLTGLVPESFETYQIVSPGNIIIRSTDLQNDKTSLRVGLVRDKGIITSAYLCLFVQKTINLNYAYYLLHAYDLLKVYYGMGSGLRQNLSFTDFKYLPLPLPSIAEQKRIAEFLDRKCGEIDEAIRKKQRLIELLEEQKTILINQAVTKGLNPGALMKDSGIDWLGEIPEHWAICNLKHTTKILRGKFSHRPRNDPRFYDGDYPFIQTGDIADSGKYIETYSQTLNKAGYRISKEFSTGTVAMVITGAKTGEVSILSFNACFPDSAVGFFPDKQKIETEFLYFLLKHLKSRLDEVTITSTQENLNVDRIGSVQIGYPPLKEQRAIIDFLNHIFIRFEQIKDQNNLQINKLTELKQILIAEAVTGKIKV